MNTNIVKYILETTDMTQTDIANQLKAKKRKGSDEETKITQASISQWSRGEKLPEDREIELLVIAGLYWELEYTYDYETYEDPDLPPDEESIPLPEWMRSREVDSRWNVIVKSEQNQEDWYNFFTEMLAPKKFKNKDSEYKDIDFVKFVRECIFALNDAGFKVPENPESIKQNTSSRFFDFFKLWMHQITILQYWCPYSIPHSQNDSRFTELYNHLPKIALAQTSLGDIDLPEQTDVILLRNFNDGMNIYVNAVIEGYYHWQNMELVSFFDDNSFNEILIYSNDDLNDNISQSSSTPPSDEIQKNDDIYLSYSEKKILDGIKNNEKLLKENNKLLKDQDKLLKEILEKLNNNNNGEVNGK